MSHEEIKTPLGTWPAVKYQNNIGAVAWHTTEHGFDALGMVLLTRTHGIEVPEAKELIVGAKKECCSSNILPCSVQYVSRAPYRMLVLICGKTDTCTTPRNHSRVISSDNVRWGNLEFQDFRITGDLLQYP